jgi:sarcosine oxidase/L-pipecolate oxidase
MFPPQEDGIIKFGAVNFVTNYHSSHKEVSLPRYRSDNPSDGVPEPIETHIRKWLKQIIPELADREWFETRICWYELSLLPFSKAFTNSDRRDADMPDYNFLIGAHPAHPGLKLAVGGSAHGFKFMPILGKYIVDMIEGTLDEEMVSKWRWRPGAKLLGANPHPTPLLDLNDIPGWKKDTSKIGEHRSSKL